MLGETPQSRERSDPRHRIAQDKALISFYRPVLVNVSKLRMFISFDLNTIATMWVSQLGNEPSLILMALGLFTDLPFS